MLNNKDIVLRLRHLGLTPEEAKVYLALLHGPLSHLQIARQSGVNRTKVYRLADDLRKKGLITEETNDTGKRLVAADPQNLEINLTTAEEQLKAQRALYEQTLPALRQLYGRPNQLGPQDFVVNTYEGVDGFKQMLWNELKTKGEILIYGNGTISDLITSPRWAEKHRLKTIEAGYKIREILNPNTKPANFTKNPEFMQKVYNQRYISPTILPLEQQMCIYNNTVAIYNWRNQQKVGTEIINQAFANMQRAVFEHYWRQAQ